MPSPVRRDLKIDTSEVESFCHRWKVVELSLFGSALRDDFGPGSDVDLLVVFDPDCHHSLFDLVTMRGELEDMFLRDVDLVEKDGLTNPFRRRTILSNRQLLYAA
jgi:predicted nucleotidyltransferase